MEEDRRFKNFPMKAKEKQKRKLLLGFQALTAIQILLCPQRAAILYSSSS